ncbi:MAG: hypothetical protein R3D33_16350 [Hyphomicrobiaceae bacterium]
MIELGGMEQAEVGSCLALFDPASSAIGLLNGAAADLMRSIEEGTDAGASARGRDARADLKRNLAAAGFGRTAPTAAWPTGRCAATGDDAAARVETPRALLLDVVVALPSCHAPSEADMAGAGDPGTQLRICCDEPVLAGLLGGVLAPMARGTSRDDAATVRIEVWAENADGLTYRVVADRGVLGRGLERAVARRLVLEELALALNGRFDVKALLHASAVVAEGGAILIVGASGAGKTTLTAGLVAAGFAYIADDLVPLGEEGRSAGRFPAALAVKAGSWPVVGALHEGLVRLPVLTTRRLQVRYLDPATLPGRQALAASTPLCRSVP